MAMHAATYATFFRFMRADWSTPGSIQSFFGKNRRQGMGFVLSVSRTTRFLSHRKVVFAVRSGKRN